MKQKIEEKKTKTEEKPKVSINYLDGRLIHIKVGDANRPATDEDIADLEKKVNKLVDDFNIDCAVLVTHHAVDIIVI